MDIKLPPSNLRFMNETDEIFHTIGSTNLSILQTHGFGNNSSILDIGSGYGRLAYGIINNLKEYNGNYTGIDILPRHILWCQENISKSYNNFRFIHLDIKNNRYNVNGKISADQINLQAIIDSEFDYSCLFSVFTHMYEQDIMNYLKNVYKLLKKDGICVATFFTFNENRLEKINQSKLNMKYLLNEFTRYHTETDQLLAIAYNEQYLKNKLESLNYKILEYSYGTWAGDISMNYQDVVVLQKL